MTELSKRAKQAEKIIKQPANFKVCEGCESIVGKDANICPNCLGYRFDSDSPRVIAQAQLLGSRPQTSVAPGDLVD